MFSLLCTGQNWGTTPGNNESPSLQAELEIFIRWRLHHACSDTIDVHSSNCQRCPWVWQHHHLLSRRAMWLNGDKMLASRVCLVREIVLIITPRYEAFRLFIVYSVEYVCSVYIQCIVWAVKWAVHRRVANFHLKYTVGVQSLHCNCLGLLQCWN